MLTYQLIEESGQLCKRLTECFNSLSIGSDRRMRVRLTIARAILRHNRRVRSRLLPIFASIHTEPPRYLPANTQNVVVEYDNQRFTMRTVSSHIAADGTIHMRLESVTPSPPPAASQSQTAQG